MLVLNTCDSAIVTLYTQLIRIHIEVVQVVDVVISWSLGRRTSIAIANTMHIPVLLPPAFLAITCGEAWMQGYCSAGFSTLEVQTWSSLWSHLCYPPRYRVHVRRNTPYYVDSDTVTRYTVNSVRRVILREYRIMRTRSVAIA